MICENCRKENSSHLIVCKYCGELIIGKNKKNIKIIRIGRNDLNELKIINPNVSQFHAAIKIEDNEYTLYDLESSNGTYLNGQKITSGRISSKDSFSFAAGDEFNIEKVLMSFSKNGIPNSNTSFTKKLTIGRSHENDIVIPNIKVSKKHAVLINLEDEWYIEDLGSSNGTFFNSQRIIRRQIVRSNDSIIIGGACFSLQELLNYKTEKKICKTSLSAENICYAVGKKKILDDITLTINSGQFVGLIGPSGSGKTTLMLLLNGMIKPTSGDVQLNFQSIFNNKNIFDGEMGYVPQDDIIHRELTVESSLKYAADLRFNEKYSEEEKLGQVQKVIDELGLEETKDVLIGDSEKRGISGGQRKRVNLGHELLTEPNILFLDEPTSGLDPVTDYEVMNLLKKISQQDKIVIITTHAITKRNFDILTHLIILTQNGKLAYYGPTSEATAYFGVKDPEAIFEVLNKHKKESWNTKYKESKYYQDFVQLKARTKTDLKYEKKSEVNITKQKQGLSKYKTLTKRYFEIKLRDKTSTAILLLQAPLIALIISMVFDKPDEKQNVYFLLIITTIFLGIQNSVKEIVSEQAIFKRENLIGVKIISYLASKLTVLSILCILQAFLLTFIVISFINIHVTFLTLFGILFLTLISSLSLGLLISSIVKTSEAANGMVPIIFIPQIILSGFVKMYKEMNDLTKILSDIMISRRSFEIALINESSNSGYFLSAGSKIPGKIYVEKYIGFSISNQSNDIIFLLSLIFVFLLITAYMLKRKIL